MKTILKNEFPIHLLYEIEKENREFQKTFQILKNQWLFIRDRLSIPEKHFFDTEFNLTFIELEKFISKLWYSHEISKYEYEKVKKQALADFNKLKYILSQGGSASLLENYELGSFNLAKAVRSLSSIKYDEDIEIAVKIIRTAFFADADIIHQKDYCGNGGANSIYWLFDELLSPSFLTDEKRWELYYNLFCLFPSDILKQQLPEFYLPFRLFDFKDLSPFCKQIQSKILIRLILSGLHLFTQPEKINPFPLKTLLENSLEEFLPHFFPEKGKEQKLDEIIVSMKKNAETQSYLKILNTFTQSQESRQVFKDFFSHSRHWFLEDIIQHHPHLIFQLVQRKERELLKPFFQFFSSELKTLRNTKSRNLLDEALSTKPLSEKLIQKFKEIGL